MTEQKKAAETKGHRTPPSKLRRGLGLLVLAVIFWLVGVLTNAIGYRSELANNIALLFGVAAFGCGFVGLCLIAWGLLTPSRD